MDKKINTDKEIVTNEKISSKEEEKEMATLIENKEITLKEMLDRISAEADTLTGENGMIELNPENPLHKEWFEIDKYKGK